MIGKSEREVYGSSVMEKPIGGSTEGIWLRKVASHKTPNQLRIYMSRKSGDNLFGREHADMLDAVKANDLYTSISEEWQFYQLSEKFRTEMSALLQRQAEEAARSSNGQQPEAQDK
jgi:hypothetical protein